MYKYTKFDVHKAKSSEDIEQTVYSYVQCTYDLLTRKSIAVFLYLLPTHIWNITTIPRKSSYDIEWTPCDLLTDILTKRRKGKHNNLTKYTKYEHNEEVSQNMGRENDFMLSSFLWKRVERADLLV
jgi:hypothetical protein